MSAPEKTPAVNRKLLILLGAVAALALLAVFVVMPLLTSDPFEEVELASPPAAGGPDADADASDGAEGPEDADEDDGDVEETFEVFTARDPFKQLVVPAVADAAPEGGEPVDGQAPADGAAPADGVAPVEGQAPADPAENPTGGQTAQPPPEQKVEVDIVELVEVYRDGGEDKVQVTVNATGYDVAVNERFADHYQLLSVDGDCATFLYGDNRFVLCTGDTIRK